MYELRQLHTFIAVVDAGGFTNAAKLLDLAQPTVTGRIRALENTAGTLLFRRLPGGVELTAAGTGLLPYARRIVALANEAMASMTLNGDGTSRVNIGTVASVTKHRLIPILEYANLRFPNMLVSMSSSDSVDTLAAVRQGTLDCAFFVDAVDAHEDLHTTVLCEEPLVLVGNPAHPLVGRPRVTTEDLGGVTLLRAERNASYQKQFEQTFSLAYSTVRPRVHDLDSVDTAKQSVIEGLGITLLPEVAVADELAAGVLRRISWACPLRVATQFGFSRDRSSDAMLNALLLASRQVIGEQVAQQQHRRLAS